jgi:hypothetical protein
MIFNSKNIWVNLQYHNPNQIWYDLWNEEKWIGLVRETKIPHVRVEKPISKWENWEKFLNLDKERAKGSHILKELGWGSETNWDQTL